MTEVVKLNSDDLQSAAARQAIERAGVLLRSGGLVVFPTETVYGLGGDAFDARAAARIYAAKGRPSDNPLIVHIARMEDLERVAADVPRAAYALAERFWAGPLTMILRKRPGLPEATTGGLPTVAVRFPSHPVAQALIAAGGGFVAAPSANVSGRPSPTSAAHCIEDLTGRVDLILDGGEVGIGVESSIVDLTEGVPTILRPGFITETMLAEILGEVRTDPAILNGRADKDRDLKPKAPGMKYRHYAPRGCMTLVEGDASAVARHILAETARCLAAGRRTAVLASDEMIDACARQMKSGVLLYALGGRDDPEAIARSLFAQFRQCDADGAEEIFAEAFSGDGLYLAIRNRMEKACGHRIVRV